MYKVKFQQNTIIKSFIFLLGLVLAQVLFSNSVNALSNQFPDPADFSQGSNVKALVATDNGSSFLLDAPYSAVRIYVPGNIGSVPIRIHNAGHCDGIGDSGSQPTRFTLWGLTSDEVGTRGPWGAYSANSSCDGADINWNFNLSNAETITNATTGRHIGYKVVELRADRNPGGAGWNTFSISSSYPPCGATLGTSACSIISYFDLNSYDRFALKSNGGTGNGNFNLRFRSNCSPISGNRNLLYYDADAGESNQGFENPVRTNVNGATRNIFATSPGGYQIGGGGQAQSGQLTFPFQQGVNYTWQWQNIASSNGIQFGLPFDGFNYIYSCPTNPDATCISATPNFINAGVNAPASFTVRVRNTGGVRWDNSFSLRQTYWSNINPNQQTLSRSINGGTVGGHAYSGPGALNASSEGNFNITVSRAAPGDFVFRLQMQQNNGLLGNYCDVTVRVGNPPPRPDCYIRHVVGGADQANMAPYEYTSPNGGPVNVHIRAQQLNPGPTNWGPRYFMTEAYTGANGFYGPTNVGNVNLVVPGAYTGVFDRFHTLNVGTHRFTYWMYLTTPAGVTGPAAGTSPCSIDVVVSPPPVYNPTGGASGNCQTINGSISLLGGPGSGYLQVIGGPSDGARKAVSGSFNTSSFSGWNRVLPPHVSHLIYLYAFASDGTVRDSSGNPNAPLATFRIGPCVSISCNASSSTYEFDASSQFRLSYGVTNTTNVSFGGYSVALSSPPGGTTSSNPSLAGNGTTSYTRDFRPTTNTVVTGTLLYNGASTGFTSSPSCLINVVRYPYLKAYGSDVMAGGGFGQGCSTNTSGIFARMRAINEQSSTNRSGSGSQLGAFAWGNVTGFASATMRTATPTATAGNGLHFGGQSGYLTTSQTADMGGNLGGNAICLPNYYTDTQYPIGSDVRIDPGSNSIDQTRITPANNNKQIFSSGLTTVNISGNYQGRRTYYVNGDVRITSNVVYAPYASVANIPNFTLVVTGNIYIDRNVTQLDGVYIAQPNTTNPTTTGRIYTCATGSTAHTSDVAVYNNCSGGYGVAGMNIQRLTVNGTFIAQKVILNRAVNTLANSTFREPRTTSAAAEVFNFTPEIYLSPPIFRSISGPTSSTYQSIAVLPPIL